MKNPAAPIDIPLAATYLPKYKIWRIDGDMTGMVVECLEGMLWITQKDDVNDHILGRGDVFTVTRPGVVLVQALRDARFRCRCGAMPYARPCSGEWAAA